MRRYLAIFLTLVLTLLFTPKFSFAEEPIKQMGNRIIDFSAGTSHVLAITDSGILLAWGSNSYGELGNGSNINSTEPIQIGTDTDWLKIYAGKNNSFAIKKNGTLWAWGSNSFGQLGIGDTRNYNVPVQIGTSNDWEKVLTGDSFSIGLKKDGSIWICKDGDGYQFKKFLDGSWVDISVGVNHLLALKSDGSLWSWGNNNNGELGIGIDGHTNVGFFDSIHQVGQDHDWVIISAGNGFSIAQKKDGSVWKWGATNNNVNVLTPQKIAENMNFEKISTSLHTVGVKFDGTLWTLGKDNGSSQIFDVGTQFQQTGTDADWSDVKSGNSFTIGLKADGSLWSWGYNKYGQLGNGTQTDRLIPVQVGDKNNWTQVSSSGEHTVATDTYGDLWVWGQNFGYLGDGTWSTKYSPEKISTVSNVTYIEAGGYSNFVFDKDNALYVWGNNSSFQLGDGTNNDIYKPKLIGNRDWKVVSTEPCGTFGLKNNGTLWFWGTDCNGFFFGSDYPWKTLKEPIQIGIEDDWGKISAGSSLLIAIKKDGSLWEGGNNRKSAVLDNSLGIKRIGIDNDWDEISVNGNYAVAIKKDGSLWFWGDDMINSYSRGVPIKTINSPERVGTDTDWIKASVGGDYVLLLKRDGTIWAFGNNRSGQFGVGSRESSNVPIQISNQKWNAISAGGESSFGIRNDGTLWSWGSNDLYSLGLGTINITTDPSRINMNFPIVNVVKSNDTVVNGLTNPNADVRISINLNVIASGKADDKGVFSIKIEKQFAGTKLSIMAIDLSGQASGVTTISVLNDINNSTPSHSDSTDSEGIQTGGGTSGAPTVEEPKKDETATKEKSFIKDVFMKNIDIVKLVHSLNERLVTLKKSSETIFSDTKSHWGSQSINIFVKLGVISGYGDGSFHPDEKITRAEFATIISKLFNVETSAEVSSFTDVNGHWAKDSIQALASHGIINGYENGSFKPDSTITRSEIIAILSRIINLSDVQKSGNVTFRDISGDWNSEQIKEASGAGLIEGRDSSTFAPEEFSTRVESLTIILRALSLNPDIKSILDQLK